MILRVLMLCVFLTSCDVTAQDESCFGKVDLYEWDRHYLENLNNSDGKSEYFPYISDGVLFVETKCSRSALINEVKKLGFSPDEFNSESIEFISEEQYLSDGHGQVFDLGDIF